ncbi:MAG TPA: choice-of-anchor I family protein [Pyrinomonadaceae bacterium]
MKKSAPFVCALALLLATAAPPDASAGKGTAANKGKEKNIKLTPVGTFSARVFDQGAAEIVAHDPATQRLFVVNGAASSIDVLSVADPSNPALLFSIDVTPHGAQANSVAVRDGVVAAAVQADPKTAPGKVVFFDASGNHLDDVTVGALPDMLTFTPDGARLLVANEGEPSGYNQAASVDPEGSVSIVDLRAGVGNLDDSDVTTAQFPADVPRTNPESIRVYGPNATPAQDFEPEYVAVSHDSKTAWVTLQENNAIALLDVRAGRFTEIAGLGFKDHSLAGNGLDPSDRDSANLIANWPVFGMYQPDAVATFRVGGETYIVTANEGDARDWPGLAEEARVGSLALDPAAFPNSTFLKNNARLGRLNVTNRRGDTDGDGDFDRLYAIGARSFSVRRADVSLIYDSGDQIEQITRAALPDFFNAGHTTNARDDRSDNKGPEPEGLAVGKAFGRTYAFVGLERIGGVLVYDLTDPSAPRLVQYVNNRDFAIDPQAGTLAATVGDLGPEGLTFIPAEESPNGRPLLVVANEVSGTTTLYEIAKAD